MIDSRKILRSGWLYPLVGMTIALTALAYFAVATPSTSASESKVGGIVSSDAYMLGGDGAVNALDEWTTILDGDIQTSQWEDVVMDVSLECGLTTDTTVKSSKGKEDTSMAEAGVKLQVLVDGVAAEPGVVTYCSRMQEQTAKFGGILEYCEDSLTEDTDGDGVADAGDGVITIDECEFSDEELQLVLDTMHANAFNFFTLDLAQGDHHVEVQAKLYENTEYQAGGAAAHASIGKGSVSIFEVKFVKSENLGQ